MHKGPICTAPWTTLIINGSNYNCCCFYGMEQIHSAFPSSRNSVMEIFNSQPYQKLRQRLLRGDIAGTACETCLERQGDRMGIQDAPGRKMTEQQTNVFLNAMESAKQGETIVNHAPISFSLNTCTDCNLQCIMCYNSNLPENRYVGSLAPYQKFISMLNDIGLCNVNSICAVGGETFMTQDALEIIDFLSRHQETGVFFSTNTNGSLLHKHQDLLKRFENIALQFSIEGYGETYEKIRRGASWDRLLKNIDWCVEQARLRPGWNLSANSLIMKSSLPDMKRVVELLRDKVGFIRFTPVMGDYYNENIFQFPELLQGIDWERHFDEAIDAADQYFPESARQLRSARSQIQRCVTQKHSRLVYSGAPEKFSMMLEYIETQCQQPDVYLLGTRSCLTDFLTWCHDRTTKNLTLASFDIRDTSRTYVGWPVTTMEALPVDAQDFVLCCETFKFSKYRDFLKKSYPLAEIKVLPYWNAEVFSTVQKTVQDLHGSPVLLYATGGATEILLETTELARLDITAFSDGNPKKHGTSFYSKPVVPPEQIPHYTQDVIICSDIYTHSIAQHLEELHGNTLRIHRIF